MQTLSTKDRDSDRGSMIEKKGVRVYLLGVARALQWTAAELFGPNHGILQLASSRLVAEWTDARRRVFRVSLPTVTRVQQLLTRTYEVAASSTRLNVPDWSSRLLGTTLKHSIELGMCRTLCDTTSVFCQLQISTEDRT